MQFGAWPRLVKQPGHVRRSLDVEAAVNHHAGDAGQAVGVAQQLPVFQPRRVREVVRAQPGERHPEAGIGIPLARGPALLQGDDRVLPVTPVLRRAAPDGWIGIGVEQPVVRRNQVLGVPAAVGVPPPFRREEPARLVVEPVHVGGTGHGAGHQHHLRHPLRVALGVREPQRHAPRTAPDQPPVDAQVLAQPLDVTDQVLGGVGVQAGAQVRDRRRAPPAAPLVELDETVRVRVERPPPPRRKTAPRPAVQRHGRLTVRIAADLPVHELPGPHVQHSRVIRLDGREPLRHDDHSKTEDQNHEAERSVVPPLSRVRSPVLAGHNNSIFGGMIGPRRVTYRP